MMPGREDFQAAGSRPRHAKTPETALRTAKTTASPMMVFAMSDGRKQRLRKPP